LFIAPDVLKLCVLVDSISDESLRQDIEIELIRLFTAIGKEWIIEQIDKNNKNPQKQTT
jgi:hypothetical protein